MAKPLKGLGNHDVGNGFSGFQEGRGALPKAFSNGLVIMPIKP
jgi:hypothetical protein